MQGRTAEARLYFYNEIQTIANSVLVKSQQKQLQSQNECPATQRSTLGHLPPSTPPARAAHPAQADQEPTVPKERLPAPWASAPPHPQTCTPPQGQPHAGNHILPGVGLPWDRVVGT